MYVPVFLAMLCSLRTFEWLGSTVIAKVWSDSPESITFPKLSELYSNDATKRWSNKSSLQRAFAHPTREQVDVIHCCINSFETSYHFRWYLTGQVFKTGCSFQVAQCTVVIVWSNGMVTTSTQKPCIKKLYNYNAQNLSMTSKPGINKPLNSYPNKWNITADKGKGFQIY